MYPADLKYTKDHEWLKIAADGTAVVGITHYAQDALGDVVYESGRPLAHVYFPTTSIVSLLYVLENGASAEIAVVGYEGVVVTTPVSIPYERYSTHPAQWWIGRALAELGRTSGLGPADFDGLCASSFTMHPDTSIALTQHFGLTVCGPHHRTSMAC